MGKCTIPQEVGVGLTSCRTGKLEPPGTQSSTAYTTVEAGLVTAVMASVDKAGPIQLSPQQQRVAEKLAKGIEDGYSDSSCVKILYNLLLSLYLPEDPSRHAADVFSSPVVAFLALQCKSQQGVYCDTSVLGQVTAKMQTCIRFHCFGHLMRKLLAVVDTGDNNEWIKYVTPFALIH